MKQKKLDVYGTVRYVILIILSSATMLPFLVLPVVSLKSKKEFLVSPLTLPETLNFSNYLEVFKRSNIMGAFINSVVIMLGALFLELVLGALTAYALTKMKFSRAGTFSGIFLAPMIFPIQSITVPLYLIFKNVGLLNSYMGMILIEAALGLPMTIFMMTSFMKTIPIQISESATLDGAGNATILFKLIVPLLKPVISTISVVCGISIWNAFYMPIIVMYCFLQKNIINGVAAGAVKG